MGYLLQPAIHICVMSINSWDSPFLLFLSFCFSIRKVRPFHYHGLTSRPLRSWQSGAQETQTLSLPQGCPLSSLLGAASSQFLARSTSHHS